MEGKNEKLIFTTGDPAELKKLHGLFVTQALFLKSFSFIGKCIKQYKTETINDELRLVCLSTLTMTFELLKTNQIPNKTLKLL